MERFDNNNQPYLSDNGNLAGILKVDCFQPFGNFQHYVGFIYITILNLSRKSVSDQKQ